jgi:tetratricopeptide (TPR) repeat protein/DNA-binding winged helix-turn-helix (wHTH) protein
MSQHHRNLGEPGSIRTSMGTLDAERRLWVGLDGAAVRLTPLECQLLCYLGSQPGVTISRAELLETVWGYAPGVKTRAVAHVVHRLRQRLGDAAILLQSVYGGGYRLDGVIHQPAPLPATSDLVGRDALLGALRTPTARWTTLHGPGGVGKTRLAREAHPVALWVELDHARRPGQILVETAMVLGVPLEGTAADSRRRITDALDDRGATTLVLDNLEQLDPSCRALFEDWLTAAPRLTVVATARSAVGLDAEQLVEVPPLDADAAWTLFTRLARRHLPTFDPDPAAEAWRDVLASVDHLPLALELLAPRITHLRPEAVLARLGASNELLRRAGGARHDALERSLEWSWDLLSDGEREALAALSTIPSTFGLEQAEAVIGTDDALALLDSLRKASWLSLEDGRYRLYSSSRPFLGTRPSAGGAEDRRRRWLVQNAAEASRAWLLRHVHDLEEAVRRGHATDPTSCATLCTALCTVASALPDDRLLQLNRLALDAVVPRSADWIQLAVDRLALCRRSGTAPGVSIDEVVDASAGTGRLESRAWRCKAQLLRDEGRLDDAREAARHAITLADAEDAPEEEAAAWLTLGLIRRRGGDRLGAVEALQTAWATGRDVDPTSEVRVLGNLGATLRQLGRTEEAEQVLRTALDRLDPAMQLDRALLLHNLGNLAFEERRYPEARACFEQAAAALEGLGARERLGTTLLSLVALELAVGQTAIAGAHARWACRVLRRASDRRLRAWATVMRCVADLREGRTDVLAELDQVRGVFVELGAHDLLETVDGLRAIAGVLAGHPAPPVHDPLTRLATLLASGRAPTEQEAAELAQDGMGRVLVPLLDTR